MATMGSWATVSPPVRWDVPVRDWSRGGGTHDGDQSGDTMTSAGGMHSDATSPADDVVGVITELRVHGVGGAAPEELLGLAHVELVAGTSEAGFFQPTSWLPSGTEADQLEAYSWGGITSRSRSRALWIILLPFAMLNIAGWMFPAGDEGWRRTVSVLMVRLAALLNTAIFTSMFGVLLIDVMGNQCAVTEGCTGTWFMGPWRWWASSPSEAMALSVGALALLMIGVAGVARASRSHAAQNVAGLDHDPARRVNLTSPELWRRGDVAHWLGMSHASLALGTVTLLGVEAGARFQAGAAGERPGFTDSLSLLDSLTTGLWVSLVLGLVAVVVSIGLVANLGPLTRRLLLPVLAVSVVGVVVTGWSLFALPSDESGTQRALDNPDNLDSLVMVQSITRVIFGAFAVLFAIFWIRYLMRAGLRMVRPSRTKLTEEIIDLTSVAIPAASSGPGEGIVRRIRRAFARVWINDNDPIMSLQAVVPFFGAGVVVAIGASVILQAQRLLGTAYPEDRLTEVAVFGFGWVVILVVVGIAGWFSAPGRLPSQIAADYVDDGEGTEADSPGPASEVQIDSADDQGWLKRISSAESAAQIIDRAETLMTIPALVVMVALIAGGLLGVHDSVLAVSAPAVWAMSLLPVVLMGAMNRLYRDRNFRRTLGIVWDVATFWPRWFHPWAPPSYGERAVDQLRRRLEVLTETGGVILSAHSQGTVMSAAALAQLAPEHRARVAVISHGSPLTRIYGRYFSEFYSVAVLTTIAEDLVQPVDAASDGSSWRNLYRRTDYIGGPINRRSTPDYDGGDGSTVSDERTSDESASDGRGIVDVVLRDPHDPAPLMRGDPRPVTLNHSDYYADPVYDATVRELAARLKSQVAAPTPGPSAGSSRSAQ